MTNYKTLCAELIDHARLAQMLLTGEGLWDGDEDDGLLDRARAALAEPVPEGPSDEELLELWSGWNIGFDPQKGPVLMPHPAEYARAVLARWRRLAPLAEPEPSAECAEAEQTDSDLLQFLLDNFRSRSLHMDGTAYYVLDRGWPFNHRSSNSRAFVEQAYHKSCEHLRKQP